MAAFKPFLPNNIQLASIRLWLHVNGSTPWYDARTLILIASEGERDPAELYKRTLSKFRPDN